jgi:hypothetical protein
VPESGIPREWVDTAREAIKDNQRQSANGDRFWELSGGILYCAECGCRMTVHATLDSRNGRRYCYYRCPKRGRRGVQKVCINGKHHRAAEAKTAVWDLISRLLKDPERVRAGLEEMIEQERCRYLHFATKAHMADEGLDETLAQTRMMAEAAAH